MHKTIFNLFYYGLVLLFMIPPIYMGIGYSHGIGKYLTILLFCYYLFYVSVNKKHFPSAKFETAAILFYIFSLALSIIPVLDPGAYLHRFKDIIIAIMFYVIGTHILSQNEKNHQKYFLAIILFSVTINSLAKFVLYLYPDSINTFFPKVFYPDYINTIRINLDRDRIYFESYDEIFIPAMFIIISSRSLIEKSIGLSISLFITITSFISNFRTKFLMLFASLFLGIFLAGRKKFRSTLLVSGALVTTVFIAIQLVGNLRGFTVIDRFLLQDEMEDVVSITRRRELFEVGISLGLSSPLYGIGLNQFDYYVEAAAFPTDPRKGASRDLLSDDRRPHDLLSFTFAETGIVGLTALSILFLSFVYRDQQTLNSGSRFDRALVGAFWTLVIFSLLNPAANFSYTILFWILRTHLAQSIKS